ncbi:MAG TPA: putative sulfate exporter family transporter [Polyangiaceae bacterium]
MSRPQWIPARADLPGLALAGTLGAAALVLVRVLPASPLLSDVLVALVLGALVLNTPLRRIVRLELPGDEREPDVYAPGVRFCGKWVLRAAIIAMGLKVQTSFFGGVELALIAGVGVIAMPSAFFVAHTLGALLGLRRPLVDLLAGGTMICGASAVNAIAPVAGARRGEQGIAIGVVFLFSVVALVFFRPIAAWLGLEPSFAGIWSGLAVNDLSSAVAVGTQMGGAGGVMAAAAKSARVLMLGPVLVVFAMMRRDGGPTKGVGKSIVDALPRFVLGYIALAVVRAVGDRTLGGTAAWSWFLSADRFFVDLTMATVTASIGLHLALRALLASGARAVAVGAGASATIASLTLGMIAYASHGAHAAAALVGGIGLVGSALAYRLATARGTASRGLRRRFERGAPLALAEATAVLDGLEADGALDEKALREVMHQLHPAIGELIPVRESPLHHGEGCRWVTYWEGKTGWALVAVCRDAGSVTPIHAHPHRLMGKAIEGTVEELTFEERGAGAFSLRTRKVLGHNQLIETEGLSALHLVHAVGDRAAIDVQLRGPEVGSPGRRLKTTVDPLSLAIGATFQGEFEIDDRPGQAGEGAAAGRRPELT